MKLCNQENCRSEIIMGEDILWVHMFRFDSPLEENIQQRAIVDDSWSTKGIHTQRTHLRYDRLYERSSGKLRF